MAHATVIVHVNVIQCVLESIEGINCLGNNTQAVCILYLFSIEGS